MTTHKKQWMTSDLAQTVKDYAWRERTTVGAVIRDILTDYDEHGHEANLAPIDVPAHEAKVTYRVDDELWERVMKRAESEGVSVAGVIRRGIVARTTGVRA